MKIERGPGFAEQRGSSSALLRAEGEKELFPHVPVAMSHKPYQFVGIHSYLPYMALSLSLFHCHCISSTLPLSVELSAAPCQGNAVN